MKKFQLKIKLTNFTYYDMTLLFYLCVQAALAPDALDKVRGDPDHSQIDIDRGEQMLTIAVLSILVTAPLGSIGITLGGPRLLSRGDEDNTPDDDDKRKEIATERV